MQIKTMQIK